MRPSARSGAPGAPAADRSRSAPRGRACGRRVTRASAAGSIATTRASASASIFCACSTCEKNSALWPTPDRSPRRRNPLRPQEREHCGMLGEVLRNAQRIPRAARPRVPGSRRSGSTLTPHRPGRRDVREQSRVETVRLARPERSRLRRGRHSQVRPSGSRASQPAGSTGRACAYSDARFCGSGGRDGAPTPVGPDSWRESRRGNRRRAARPAVPASLAPMPPAESAL